jgi:hypothetical protein
MTDSRHRPNHRSRMTGGSLLGSRDLVPSHLRTVGAHHDRVVMLCRLRTIVDALLHRVATSPDRGTVMAAMNTRPETEGHTDG